MRISTIVFDSNVQYFDNRINYDKRGEPEQTLTAAFLMLQQ